MLNINTITEDKMTQAKGKALNWDGKSRVSNDVYRKRFDEIFKKEKTTSELLREGYEEEKKMLEEEDGITEETN
jgi:hypothetical protein|tara:strand:- start:273 stop:494 length:222 start_codon:yes stop_codon:yes gene_type:complete